MERCSFITMHINNLARNAIFQVETRRISPFSVGLFSKSLLMGSGRLSCRTHRTLGNGYPEALSIKNSEFNSFNMHLPQDNWVNSTLHFSIVDCPSVTITSLDVSSSIISAGTTTSKVPAVERCGSVLIWHLQWLIKANQILGKLLRYGTIMFSHAHIAPTIILLNILDMQCPSVMSIVGYAEAMIMGNLSKYYKKKYLIP